MIAVLAVCLCAAPKTAAQDKDAARLNPEQAGRRALGPPCVPALAGEAVLDKDAYRIDSELARRIAVNVERTIRAKEPRWRLHEGRALGHIFTQAWKSDGGSRLSIEFYVCETSEGASRTLASRGSFNIAMSQKLEDFGDEAGYIVYPYFTWVGVRKGRLVATVQGPGRAMPTTRRFARYVLEQLVADPVAGEVVK